MTEREAAIVSAYTGYLIGSFDAMQKYVEELMEGPVWTHQLASGEFAEEIRKRAKADFVAMEVK